VIFSESGRAIVGKVRSLFEKDDAVPLALSKTELLGGRIETSYFATSFTLTKGSNFRNPLSEVSNTSPWESAVAAIN
jgi:hypothetical protein